MKKTKHKLVDFNPKKKNNFQTHRRTNQRTTIQRMKVLEFLQSVDTHPTAEEIYKEVSRQIPTITLATVYRNLNILADNNEILRFEFNKELHFDGNIKPHYHFACTNKNKIIDIFPNKYNKINLDRIKTALKQKVNEINSVDFFQIFIYGECK